MACNTTHLLTGNALLCKSIKAATSKLYIKAVKDFLMIITNGISVFSNKVSLLLSLLLSTKKPSVSNLYLREPLSIEMVHSLIASASTFHQHSPECILGLQSGFRSSERCLSSSNKSLPLSATVIKNIDSSAATFIFEDFI